MKNKKILYLTYDGINDPIGQSQVAPYIEGIASDYFKFYVISFEKKNSLNKYNFKNKHVLKWNKYKFTKKLFFFGKVYDYIKLLIITLVFAKRFKINCIHARSFIPGITAYITKKFFDIEYIYDSRGLWVDERIDNYSINIKNLFGKIIYNYLKTLEKKVFKKADFVIVLTYKAKNFLSVKKYCHIKKIIIIPCSIDYDLFNPNIKKSDIHKIKNDLNIKENNFVITYNGSIGGVYLFEQMLSVFILVNKLFKNVTFLIITNNKYEALKIIQRKYENYKDNIKIVNSSRLNMPRYLVLSDVNFFLIKPSFARTASFPTKLSESFAMNVPVICNEGVGDIDKILYKFHLGLTFNNFKKLNKITLLKTYIKLKKFKNIRNKTINFFNLNIAIKRYIRIYRKMYLNENITN